MSKNAVDYRAKLISQQSRGLDPLVDNILDALTAKDEMTLTQLELVRSIAKDKVQKLYVESSMIATSDLDLISSFLEVEVEVLDLYRALYYDIEGFTKLQKLAHIDRIKDPGEKGMKTWALSQGMLFLEWRFGNRVAITPVEGLTNLFNDSYFKSKEAFFNHNGTEATKEALKWVKQTTDLARQLKLWVTDSEEAMKDINIALQKLTGDDIKFKTMDELMNEEPTTDEEE